MGAALNSLLDEVKGDGNYTSIFYNAANNVTDSFGCAPDVRADTTPCLAHFHACLA